MDAGESPAQTIECYDSTFYFMGDGPLGIIEEIYGFGHDTLEEL